MTFMNRTSARLVGIWAGLLLMMGAWAIASPVAAGPDESGHIMKAAATVRGHFVGTPTAAQGVRSFVLPANVGDLGGDVTCFAGQPNQTAACAPSLGSLPGTPTTVLSGVAAYNPVYYAFVGLPSLLLDGTSMVLAMRLLNALVVSLLWTACFAGMVVARPRAMYFIWLAATPFAIYLGGIVNPSGAEVAATAAVLILLDLVVRRGERVGPLLATGLGAAAALLVSLRSISPVFLALAVLVVVLLRGVKPFLRIFRQKGILIATSGVFLASLFAAYWTIVVGSQAGFIPSAGVERPGRLEAFFTTLTAFPNHLIEMVGVMGWFDARPPDFVHWVWMVLIAGVLLLVFVSATRRQLCVFALCVTSVLAIPAVLQAVYASEYGYIWQGRYALPLLVLSLIAGGIAVEEGRPSPRADARYAMLISVLFALQISTFIVVLKRYSVGVGAPWELMSTSAAWRPPGGVAPVVALFVAGAALLVWIVWTTADVTQKRTLGTP